MNKIWRISSNRKDADADLDSQSDMVKTMAPVYKGEKQPTMFAAADNKTHARIRRPVAGAYSMTNVVQVRKSGRVSRSRMHVEPVWVSSKPHSFGHPNGQTGQC